MGVDLNFFGIFSKGLGSVHSNLGVKLLPTLVLFNVEFM
uniref:Uncharacterized protein n=1 Tax=Rhizophora mucronata TaxID=61149 RepID=A0A2P2IZY3_RHIMU